MSDLTLEVERREAGGKNANRRLRAAGKVPAVVYGIGLEPATIQLSRTKIEEFLRKSADDNPVFLLKLEGTDQARHAMIRELTVDPITGKAQHIDFQRVDMEKAVQVSVALELTGVPAGVKNDGGLLDQVLRELEISCLPGNIPGHLEFDVSDLSIGDHVEAGQVELPEGVELLDDPQRTVASVQAKKIEAESVPGLEGEEPDEIEATGQE
ncbi:MAG: 50S ribosomal protein L25 [Acidobacteriota bacterium]